MVDYFTRTRLVCDQALLVSTRRVNNNYYCSKMSEIILQSEASECGLACLAMISRANGGRHNLRTLRAAFPGSLKGLSLRRMIQIGREIGLAARPVRLEPVSLRKLKLPCILHWEMNHFVVLSGIEKSSFIILDPSAGKLKISAESFSSKFTGIAVEFSATSSLGSEPEPERVNLVQLTGGVRGLKRIAAQILLLSVSLQVFVVLAPFFMQWVIDQVLVSGDSGLLLTLGAGFSIALVLQVAIAQIRGAAVVYVSSQLGMKWMRNVFTHVLHLPMSFFERRHLGDINSRISSIGAIQRTLTTQFVESLIDGAMATAALVLMFFYNVKLAAISASTCLLYIIIRILLHGHIHRRTEAQLACSAAQQTHLFESLRGMQSIKVNGQESIRNAAFDNLLTDTVNHEVVLGRFHTILDSANLFVFGISRIFIIWVGATVVLSSSFSVGMLVAYLAYNEIFAQRVAVLVNNYFDFKMLGVHCERLADITLEKPEKFISVGASPPTEGSVEVKNVSFRYAEGEPWIVRDCSLNIAPGDSVAIVGASGCGKSTLMKLMLGLLTPTEGTILVGGLDINRYGASSMRDVVGAVMQDDQLFVGTIGENISFFDPNHDQERVEWASRLAAVDDDIASMPMQYKSLIGDMGSALSGGQRQRVILARALYRNPKIIFLDEATSSLDVLKESQVNASIKMLSLTRVIVAHRPQTIASADRVLTMVGGQAKEVGQNYDFFLQS
ncbi:peptidase domain-containing ABC transporter [Xanthomonas translucens]|uniref:peptidase domain-containing ABC transporter n=1 Tax=Xanthomonas campestris pv. translucens TaxID=343 RepID=UPI003CCEF749